MSKSLRVCGKIPNEIYLTISRGDGMGMACVGVKIKILFPAFQYVLGPGFFKPGKDNTAMPRMHLDGTFSSIRPH